ncbi:MAG: hypothetical protein RBT64_11640 [Trichloromonas sp.]|nr:hypothetical protein [Trichloromonas sp.]
MNAALLTQYLQRRALPGPWTIEGCPEGDFAAAVVIPALAEGESLRATLASLAENPREDLARTLILVVVNHSEAAASSIRTANLADLCRLRGWPDSPLRLAWVDAASPGRELPAKNAGVGLARKLGFDLALTRLATGSGRPFLVSLDADTLVRPGYLPALFRHFANARAGGAVLPFAHQPGRDAAEERAIERYELYLRHYVLGLELAGSPYAFHAVGSALACRADTYLKAGGMNRRGAGEDFYFLQQLAKTSGVAPVAGTLVRPSSRPSERTPFGTGRSVARLLAGEESAAGFYDPRAFRILGQWLELVAAQGQSSGGVLLATVRQSSEDLAGYLDDLNFVSTWERLRRNHPRPEALLQAFHGWFDGLATLRLIHTLFPQRLSPEAALPELLAWAGLPAGGGPGEFLARLRERQSAL